MKEEVLKILKEIKDKAKEAERKGEKKIKYAHISENKTGFSSVYCNGCGWIYLEIGESQKSKLLPGIEYVIVDRDGKIYYACSVECLGKIFKINEITVATVYTASDYIDYLIEKFNKSSKDE